jgi:hypothetical protein
MRTGLMSGAVDKVDPIVKTKKVPSITWLMG